MSEVVSATEVLQRLVRCEQGMKATASAPWPSQLHWYETMLRELIADAKQVLLYGDLTVADLRDQGGQVTSMEMSVDDDGEMTITTEIVMPAGWEAPA